MINRLTGTLTGLSESRLLLLSGPIEWDITVSGNTSRKLKDSGSETAVFTYLHHREDQLSLYGFATEKERTIFLDLIKVSGIGPKQACKILSGMSEELFIRSLDQGDIDALALLPGVGKKTAQKIVLALRGKLAEQTQEDGRYSDVLNALVEMGFDKKEAGNAVNRLAGLPEIEALAPESAEKEILKRAIVSLSS